MIDRSDAIVPVRLEEYPGACTAQEFASLVQLVRGMQLHNRGVAMLDAQVEM